MHPRILAQRNDVASKRSAAAAEALAERFGLHEQASALRVEEKQPEFQQLVRNEAVADFLEALDAMLAAHDAQVKDDLATATAAAAYDAGNELLARIEAIEGITPEIMAIINDGLAPTPNEGEPGPPGKEPAAKQTTASKKKGG